MTLFKTDQLIHNYLKAEQLNLSTQQKELIEPIRAYFPDWTCRDIQTTLLKHGLFNPANSTQIILKKWLDQDYRTIVESHFNDLQKEWSGPDLSIFLFPIDVLKQNTHEFDQHISGLGFSDKIFLFCDWQTSKKWLYATLAHEYSHSIRLQKLHGNDPNIRLKDTLILEGIAECITRKLYDISLLPKSVQVNDELKGAFEKWIKPHLDISINHPLHHHLIYGIDPIPKYLGYSIGAYLVGQWFATQQIKVNELIYIPTDDFFEQS
ncbi:DUF2268 domain-containing protein [Amphibacillus indicireducens]|uniref:DUF2268 domain-containing protein n=1 Tax=Amphibacillus indicireducens TaxID=1076330 RepID=A0ABP7V1A5_9BACI